MNLIKKYFKELKNNNSESLIILRLNDKIMPIDRREVYELPLEEFLQANRIGEVTDGRTIQMKSGEIEYCALEIKLKSKKTNENNFQSIIKKLEELGAPKGSTFTIEKTGQKIDFGKKEGLGIYIDAQGLDPEVYINTDINYVISEIQKLTNDKSGITKYWEIGDETAIYFYANSFLEMKESIKDFVNSYPLCKGSRIEQIA